MPQLRNRDTDTDARSFETLLNGELRNAAVRSVSIRRLPGRPEFAVLVTLSTQSNRVQLSFTACESVALDAPAHAG